METFSKKTSQKNTPVTDHALLATRKKKTRYRTARIALKGVFDIAVTDSFISTLAQVFIYAWYPLLFGDFLAI